jgi:hypothetical protein
MNATPDAERPGTRFFLDGWLFWMLLLAFYYNAYRYPLQINSAQTSPTYADTPLWLSAGKYLLIALLIGYALMVRLRSPDRMRIGRPVLALGYAALLLIPVVAGVVTATAEFVLIGFLFLAPLSLHLFAGWRFSAERVNRWVAITLVIAISVQLLQLALFLAIGRLPALGHPNSLSVRFGSVLDDPNGFGVLLAGVFPFAMVHFRGARRWALAGLMFLCLVLTQSLTAVICLVAVGLVAGSLALARRPRLAVPAALGTAAAGAIFLGLGIRFQVEISALWEAYLHSKQGSLQAHAVALQTVDELAPLNLVGIEPLPEVWEESGYLNILAHYGILYLLVFFAVGAAALLHHGREALRAGGDRRTLAFAAVGILVAFYIANIGLPLIEVFPVNLIAFLFLGLGTAGVVIREAEA